jgi:hypothetical protein
MHMEGMSDYCERNVEIAIYTNRGLEQLDGT